MKKKLVLVIMATLISTTAIPSMATSNVKTDAQDVSYVECEAFDDESWENYSYLDMLEDEKVYLSEDQYNELKDLYVKLEKAEDQNDETLADSLWIEIDAIYETAWGTFDEESVEGFEIEPIDWKAELEWYEEFASTDDYSKLELLINEVAPLEDAGQYDEADIVWDKIDLIIENYEVVSEFDDQDQDLNTIDWDAELETLKDLVSEDDYEILEKLVNEVASLEEEGNFEEADKVWDEIDTFLGDYPDAEFGGEELTTPAYYNLKNGKLILSKNVQDYADGEVKEVTKEQRILHKQLWERVQKIVPKEYMNMIVAFDLSSDGFGGMAASVVNVDDEATQWIFNYDPADVIGDNGKYDQDLIDETMVHEFGHILTLNHTQLMKERNEKSTTYTTDEGTMKKESYLNSFYQKFWKDIVQDYRLKDEEYESYDVDKLYDAESDQFVTDYAATNPAEDIAESFAFFITKDKPSNNKGSNAKINFFYEYPELVKMRDEIRSNIK